MYVPSPWGLIKESKMKVKTGLILLVVFFFSICMFAAGPVGTAGEPDKPGTPGKAERVIFSEPAPDKDGKIKILLIYDLEGVSGPGNLKSLSFTYPDFYKPMQEYLTKDVNAVLEGLFSGGAGEVFVTDGHGSGNPAPDILVDKMDKRAKMLFKDKPYNSYNDLWAPGIYDAVVMVGMHSKTGGGGFAAHTYNYGLEWIINGKSITEPELLAYGWGRVGVPVIFVCGDDTLKKQLGDMDWLQYVVVKIAKSHSEVETIPPADVYARLKAGAEQAVRNLGKCKTIQPKTPVKVQLRVTPPASLKVLDGVPGIDYKDNAVTFEAAGYLEAYKGIIAFIRVAGMGYGSILWSVVLKHPDKEKIIENFFQVVKRRWTASETGKPAPRKATEPAKKKDSKSKKRKNFGYR